MIDLSKEKVEINCSCKRKLKVSLKQFVNQEIVKCSCGIEIKLQDKNGAAKNR